MKFFFLLAVLLVGCVASAVAASPDTEIRSRTEPVTVIDGDSLQIGDTVIQLAGIDVPELGQVCENNGTFWPCGLIGAYELGKLVLFHRRDIVCFPRSVRDGAVVAECSFGDYELSERLLLDGVAAALPDAPRDYAIAEHKAREGSLGIWKGSSIPPWAWREGKRLPGEPSMPQAHETREAQAWTWGGTPLHPIHHPLHSGCVIKGKKNNGEKKALYYTPLDGGYADIAIDPSNGDRYFCSDDAARKAGWRRPNEVPAKD